MLSKHGITPHPDTIAAKNKELGKNHDVQLLEWVKEVSCSADVRSCAQKLKEELEAVNYLPVQPSISDLSKHVLSSESKASVSEEAQGQKPITMQDISTVDLSEMNFCISTEPNDIVKSICDNIKEAGIPEKALQKTTEAINAGHLKQSDLKSAVNGILQQDPPSSFQIIGDNVDLHLNVRHMSVSNKNKSLHTFNLVAMKDIVSGHDLPDTHTRTLQEVEIHEFLPAHADVEQLKKDFMILWARLIVKQLPAFSFLKGAVIYHITHQYSKEMQATSQEV